MKVSKIEGDKSSLKIEVKGEDHSLVNLLVNESYESGASSAYARQDHPMIANQTIMVRGTSPKKILDDASKKIQALSKEFLQKFK